MQKWSDNMWLFTLEEYEQLPDGFELVCIDETEAIKGVDYIDLDTRGKYIAYGVNGPLISHPYAELLNKFRLST